ncbi:MerR family transcriptional regulator, partial [Streptomyces mirabilis]
RVPGGPPVLDFTPLVPSLPPDGPAAHPYPPGGAAGSGAAPQRVAQLEERIAILTELRDSLVRRMPWLAAPDGTADEQAA